jgi:hypothetical protein
VATVGGSNSVADFDPAPSPLQPVADKARHVRPSTCGGADTILSESPEHDEQSEQIINEKGVQFIEGERHQVELEADHRLRRFACGVGNCRRRYRNIDKLRTSLPPLRSCYLILSSCSSSLSAFERPWRNWTKITRLRAAQMVAACQVDRGDSPVDYCSCT